jgi:hypothetical protein
MVRIVTIAALLSACSPGGSYSGTLVDGFTQAPREGVVVLAKSTDTADMACQVREATTDAAGAFNLQNLCGDGTYQLSLGAEHLMLDQAVTLEGATAAGVGVKVLSWRAPSGAGVFRLKDDKVESLRSFSDVAKETVLGSDVKVRYPTMKPTKVLTIGADERLVLSGKETLTRMELHPLVADSGTRQFEGEVSIEDHVYIGVAFTSDTEWEAREATVDASKVTLVDNGDRAVKYISGAAVPPGRYALLGQKDSRTYIFDFGEAPAAAAAGEAPAGE